MPESGFEMLRGDGSCRILVAGGHRQICGGLEIFMARARECLGIDDHIYTDTPGASIGGFLGYMRALSQFYRQLNNFDIVWLHYGSAFDLAYLWLAKLAGKKVAVTPHLGLGWRSMRIPILRAICNRLLSRADIVFTLYQAQAAELAFPKALARRCSVMGTFLPKRLLDGAAERPVHAGRLRVLHLARLSAAKGSFAFLQVCAKLHKRGVAFEATIAGPAAEDVREALTTEIARLGLPITLLGAVPQEEVRALLHRHDVLVNLSHQDAYPLTVLEALLCGVAPVCTRLAGTEEMAKEATGIVLVEGQDANAAVDRIQALKPDLVRQGALVVQQKFGWSGLSTRYRSAFARLAVGRKSGYQAAVTRALPQ